MTRYEIERTNPGAQGPRAGRARRPLTHGMLLGTAIVVLLLGLATGAVIVRVAAPPGASAGQTSTADHLYLTIAYNPFSRLDEYFPANFTVPANVPVVITITNYDNGTNAVEPVFTNVRGTVGGTESVTNATVSDSLLTSVPQDEIVHTFTLITGPYDVNVPIPHADGQTPTVVTFTVVFTVAGPFIWHCMAPCDPSAMDRLGLMMGTITVGG